MRIYQSKMRREKVIPVPSLLVGLVNDYEKKYGIKNGEYLFKNKKVVHLMDRHFQIR